MIPRRWLVMRHIFDRYGRADAVRTSDVAHYSTAVRRATTAGRTAPKAVINGKLFSNPDFSETIQEDLAANSAHRQIRIATVIDELSAAPSHRSIKRPAPIQANRVNPLGSARADCSDSPAHDFPLIDPFTRVLNHPFARRNRFSREHAKPFDARAGNAKLEISKLRDETWNSVFRRHTNCAK